VSTTDNDRATALDAEAIRALVEAMSQQELALFRDVIVDVRELGGVASPVVVEELAKKYADKARRLAGDGGGA